MAHGALGWTLFPLRYLDLLLLRSQGTRRIGITATCGCGSGGEVGMALNFRGGRISRPTLGASPFLVAWGFHASDGDLRVGDDPSEAVPQGETSRVVAVSAACEGKLCALVNGGDCGRGCRNPLDHVESVLARIACFGRPTSGMILV